MNELNALPKQIKRIKVFKERDEAGVLTHSANYHYQPLLEKRIIRRAAKSGNTCH